MRLVVLENHKDVLSRIGAWVIDNASKYAMPVDYEESLSSPITPLNWRDRFNQVGGMDGEFLVVLDLWYEFDDETRAEIQKELGLTTDLGQGRLFDGQALAEVLIRNSAVRRTLVVVATTEGAAGAKAKRLNELAASCDRNKDIVFSPTRTANGLSAGPGEISEILDDAVRQYIESFGEGAAERASVLRNLFLGSIAAEDEAGTLKGYFVDTDLHRALLSGNVDLILGSKGSGKSALYRMLLAESESLLQNGFVVVSAERPGGGSALGDIVSQNDLTSLDDAGIRQLWKGLLLTTVGDFLRRRHKKSRPVQAVIAGLENSGLLPKKWSIQEGFRSALLWAASYRHLEMTVETDPSTGVPSVTFRRDTSGKARHDSRSMTPDQLLGSLNEALRQLDLIAWMALDGLDSAFVSTVDGRLLEARTIAALLGVWRELRAFDRLRLKIFLRDDVFDSIVATVGLREADHRDGEPIVWDRDLLCNLIVRRLVQSDGVQRLYQVDSTSVLARVGQQARLLSQVLPRRTGGAGKAVDAFERILLALQDGRGRVVPRDLIYALTTARREQLRRFEIGYPSPSENSLFDDVSIENALAATSKFVLGMRVFAEHPELADRIESLRRGAREYCLESLAALWQIGLQEAKAAAWALCRMGVFSEGGKAGGVEYAVAPLFLKGLELDAGES